MRHSLAFVVLSFSGLWGCRPATTVHSYIRTELYSPDKVVWLNANCDIQNSDSRLEENQRANYVLALDPMSIEQKLPRQVVAYACDKSPPWARTDADRVREMIEDAEDGPAKLRSCDATLARKNFSVEVVAPGSGEVARADSFVMIRTTPVVVIPEARADEARQHGIRAGRGRSFHSVDHVSCMVAPNALIGMHVGGHMVVSLKHDPWQGYEIKLIEVGGFELRKKFLSTK